MNATCPRCHRVPVHEPDPAGHVYEEGLVIHLGEARRVLERTGAHLVGCVAGRWVGLRDGVEIYLSGDVCARCLDLEARP